MHDAYHAVRALTDLLQVLARENASGRPNGDRFSRKGVALLGDARSGAVLPLMMLLVFGTSVIVANIPLKSQTTLAMPDEFRSRAVSVRIFIGATAVPAGIAVTGWLIATFGLGMTLVISGGAVVRRLPNPQHRVFLDADAAVTSRFYVEHYPAAFSGRDDKDSARSRGVMETHE
ncbi:hypothetical protein [Myxococcus sp. SDU36]|uniref:hypothetical protein n=1 Tax=Myxococcus sp. SDU36 TaxID=2831967 RepID=UPI002542EC5C|nr:hypothetical protein [Myxococcus sp. SDU36]WIG96275.1 hypothetical protein KGD87_02130 [Myxococcus sp. SDU36]